MSVTHKLRDRLAQFSKLHTWPGMLNLLLPWLVLAAMLGVTWHVWKSTQQQVAQQVRAEFDYQVNEAVRDIELQLSTYKLLLRGMQGLFAHSDTVTREEFKGYVDVLGISESFPNIYAVGYARIIPKEAHAGHIDATRANAHRNAAASSAIAYVEPTSADMRHLLGFDMLSDAAMRTAMERSHRRNTAALSGKTVLPQHGNRQAEPVIAIFLPVFQHPGHRTADAKTTPVLEGWVYAHIRSANLTNLFSAGITEKLELSLFDGDGTAETALLTRRHNPGKPAAASALETIRTLQLAGHTWTLRARALPAISTGIDNGKPRLILIAGIGCSLLLFILMQLLIHGKAHAMRIAQEMNHALIASEFRWKYALEGAGEGVWDWNIPGNHMYLGPRLQGLLGYAEGELASNIDALKDLLHSKDRSDMMDEINACLAGDASDLETQGRIRCRDGTWKWCLLRGMVVSRDESGKPTRLIGTLADITERHQREETLRLWSTVFSNVNEAVLMTDENNMVMAANPSFSRITGYAPEEVIGRHVSILTDRSFSQDQRIAMLNSLKESGNWSGEIVGRRKNGEQYTSWFSISAVRDTYGQVTHYVTIFADISERKATEARILHLAHYDQLTDLPNRALFNDRLRQAIASARRNHTGVALLFIDLNKFKPVNDTLGHEYGDMLLREIAYRLLECIRESDTAARIGGDEFVVLLPGVSTTSDARIVAEKILQAIEEPCQLNEHRIQISASIGIAIYPQHGTNDQEILSCADHAMYQAKHGSGDHIVSIDRVAE